MKEDLRIAIRSKAMPSILAVFVFLLLSFARTFVEALPKEVLQHLKSEPLLLPLGIAVLIGMMLLALLIVLFLADKNLKLRDGVYWDKEGNPYCPACKTPIYFRWANKERNETSYDCIKCVKTSHARGLHNTFPNQ